MKYTKYTAAFTAAVFLGVGCNTAVRQHESSSPAPNILIILADDMGYGDVSAYNPGEKISTPNIDVLAGEGMRFTDAHAPSSVCTPTRYSILTGRYCWRSRLPQGVLGGYGRSLIESGRPTIAGILKDVGYHTAVIGKWHLGLDWKFRKNHAQSPPGTGNTLNSAGIVTDTDPDELDFSRPPANGPLTLGFDYSFILPASLDMGPYCYLRNDTLTEQPTALSKGNDLNTGYTGAFWRAGLMAPHFDFMEVLPTFTRDAVRYIQDRAGNPEPWFLYYAMTAPHTPWLPGKEYTASSESGQYGDFLTMTDAMVGKVLTALKESGMEDNTIVIFTSDNGPFWRPSFIEKYGHRAAYIYRGMKADVWDGGHRVPFIVRWPGKIRAGSVSDATLAQTDIMATVMDVEGMDLTKVPGEDSYSILPVLLGITGVVPDQPAVVHESSHGLYAVRKGNWKLITGCGSGGFSEPVNCDTLPGEADGQLYDMYSDPSESNNLYLERPDKVTELQELLRKIREKKSPVVRHE